MPDDLSHLLSRAELLGIFELGPDASREELRSAYHLLMRQLATSDHGELRDPEVRTRATLLALAYDALARDWARVDEPPFAQERPRHMLGEPAHVPRKGS